MNKYCLYILLIVVSFASKDVFAQGVGCAAGYDCSQRGVGIPGEMSCGNGAWESLLVSQESGGNYTIGAGNSSALGRYQFIDGTRSDIGSSLGLPCASGAGSRSGFASCPGLQDDYARALWQKDLSYLMSNAAVANAVNTGTSHECPVTASGITAMAHNVGAGCAKLWAEGGKALMYAQGPVFKGVPAGTPPCTDANGTDAIKKYACAMGGYDMSSYGVSGGGAIASGCGYGYTPASPASVHFSNSMLGCDPDIYESSKTQTQAMMQFMADRNSEIIPKPVSAEVATCGEQALAQYDAVGTTFSNPSGGSSPSMAELTKSFKSTISNALNGTLAGTAAQVINDNYAKTAGAFASAVDGSIGQAFGTTCTGVDDAWLVQQCMNIPSAGDFADMLGNILANKTGAILGSLTGFGGIKDKMCNAANGVVNGLIYNATGKAEDALNSALNPVTDTFQKPEQAVDGLFY